jgi:hypothetical protein
VASAFSRRLCFCTSGVFYDAHRREPHVAIGEISLRFAASYCVKYSAVIVGRLHTTDAGRVRVPFSRPDISEAG